MAAVEAATAAAAAAAAGPDGDVAVPDELSPIPGLPMRPEPGGLSGPLATLQLVIHRWVSSVATAADTQAAVVSLQGRVPVPARHTICTESSPQTKL